MAVAALRIAEDESRREDKASMDRTICLYVDMALAEAASLREITLEEWGSVDYAPEIDGTCVESGIMTACITGIFRVMADQGEEQLRVALQTAILA